MLRECRPVPLRGCVPGRIRAFDRSQRRVRGAAGGLDAVPARLPECQEGCGRRLGGAAFANGVRGVVCPPHVCTYSATGICRGVSSSGMDGSVGPPLGTVEWGLPRSYDNLREVASHTGGVAEQGAGVGGDRRGSPCVEVHVFGRVIGVFVREGDHKVQFRRRRRADVIAAMAFCGVTARAGAHSRAHATHGSAARGEGSLAQVDDEVRGIGALTVHQQHQGHIL